MDEVQRLAKNGSFRLACRDWPGPQLRARQFERGATAWPGWLQVGRRFCLGCIHVIKLQARRPGFVARRMKNMKRDDLRVATLPWLVYDGTTASGTRCGSSVSHGRDGSRCAVKTTQLVEADGWRWKLPPFADTPPALFCIFQTVWFHRHSPLGRIDTEPLFRMDT